jgi:protein SCO1/2
MTRVLLLVLVLASVSGASLWLITRQPAAAGLPTYWAVPDFDLVATSGKPLSRRDLANQVWIADFIFTHCAGTCPAMSLQMARVDRELAGKLGPGAPVRLVSFTVDPERDTQPVLDEYARKFEASERWTFVTGAREKIVALAVDGFKLAAGEPSNDFLHSSKLVLIDRQGQIRGFYDGVDTSAVDRLIADAVALARESAR